MYIYTPAAALWNVPHPRPVASHLPQDLPLPSTPPPAPPGPATRESNKRMSAGISTDSDTANGNVLCVNLATELMRHMSRQVGFHRCFPSSFSYSFRSSFSYSCFWFSSSFVFVSTSTFPPPLPPVPYPSALFLLLLHCGVTYTVCSL